ncbi:Hypothetical predicted protein [Octopus vulgaris]|uniref:C-type lectin domain-containing protein n=1 Tax=Octopus vulgaris TaxID=6645 RepID=A0AA36AJK8_OCTVU|nr:Hypothetical predicted protein [Octopus vulgaris]
MYWFSVSAVIRKVNLYAITFSMLLFKICLGSNAACQEYYGTRIHPSVTGIPEADILIKMSNIRSKIECFSHCMAYSKCGMIIYSGSERVCILRNIKQLPKASSFIDIPPNSIYTMLQAKKWPKENFYFGLCKDMKKDVFLWQNGEEPTYDFWMEDRPSGGDQHCGLLDHRSNHRWNDDPCDRQVGLDSNVACREYYGTRVPHPVTVIPEADRLIQM